MYRTDHTLCRRCGELTRMIETKLCDRCYELETRIKRDLKIAKEIIKDADNC